MSKAPQSKLTDTQLLILSRAAQRDDHAVELPPNLNGSAAKKVVTTLLNAGVAEEAAAKPGMPVWRRDDEGRSFALLITPNAFEVLGIEPESNPDRSHEAAAKAKQKRRRKGAGRRADSKREPASQRDAEGCGARRTGTKQALIVTLLEREQGATVDELVSATEWLPHTTRAALTGLRKKGYAIVKNKGENGKTVYRIKGDAARSKQRAAGESQAG